jgi:hypothetical protein
VNPDWDVNRILDVLGGAQAFSSECATRGWHIPAGTIVKWRKRSSIPGYGIAAAARVMEDRGHPPITEFITENGLPGGHDREVREPNDP